MTTQLLAYIEKKLSDNGINYYFEKCPVNTCYPFFTGEYIESCTNGEEGKSESCFILTGINSGSMLVLENEKEKIRKLFPETGKTVIFPDRSGAAIIYENAFAVPVDTEKFKKLQINLKVMEWRAY